MALGKISLAYSAYHQPTEFREDEELTHVTRGTPGGEYLRRFWHPIEFSSEVRDLPKRIRVLGEDLVLFRDKSGRVGLMLPYCPHRGASLEFGQPDERGIRCCYHGWQIDIDGRILDTPAEGPSSKAKDRIVHGAYPVEEYKGLIFAYMGPPDKKPSLPMFDTYGIPGTKMIPGGWTPHRKYIWPSNWVQLKENSMDVMHTCFLHTIATGPQFSTQFGIIPEVEYKETPIGMVYIAMRRVGDNVWVRLHDLVMPNIHIVSSVQEDGTKEKRYDPPFLIHWAVPIDDSHLMEIGWLLENDNLKFTEDNIRKMHFGALDDRPFEERQRQPGDYDAVVSQGPIAIHSRENLVATDRGVVMFRRLLREGIRTVQRGEDPKGLWRSDDIIRTYTQNMVIKAPQAATPEADRELMRSIGRRVLDGEFRSPEIGKQVERTADYQPA
jgi:nitrite reductase/ring-hydroxylating ferredoxin subunit